MLSRRSVWELGADVCVDGAIDAAGGALVNSSDDEDEHDVSANTASVQPIRVIAPVRHRRPSGREFVII
jgi:hypothetical protein